MTERIKILAQIQDLTKKIEKLQTCREMHAFCTELIMFAFKRDDATMEEVAKVLKKNVSTMIVLLEDLIVQE